MMLCVVGNADPETVYTIANETVSKTQYAVGESILPCEKKTVASQNNRKTMDVSMPLFSIGFKETPQSDSLYYEALYSTALEIMFGTSSPLYNELYNKGLITFLSSSYNSGKQYAFVELSGESPEPEKVYNAIKKCIQEYKDNGFSSERVETIKRALYGRYIKGLNSLETIAHSFVTAAFSGDDYLTYGDKLLSVNKESLDSVLNDALTESAISVVYGRNPA